MVKLLETVELVELYHGKRSINCYQTAMIRVHVSGSAAYSTSVQKERAWELTGAVFPAHLSLVHENTHPIKTPQVRLPRHMVN